LNTTLEKFRTKAYNKITNKGGVIKQVEIEMNVKRAYCPDCKVLVDMHEKKIGESIRLTCCRCDRLLWLKNGLNWRGVKDVNAASVQPSEAKEVKPEPREVKQAPHIEPRRETRPAGRDGQAPRREGGRPPQDNRRGPRPEGRPAARPEARTDSKPAARPASPPQPKAEVKPEAKPEVKK
jgi:ribosomal protein S27AE